MKIENQVCTLEQAKILKELGVAQDSIFCFLENSASEIELGTTDDMFQSHVDDYEFSLHPDGFEASFKEQSWSAFNVAELLQIIGSVKIEYFDNSRWYARTYELSPSSNNLCWCLATILIHRIENGFTPVQEVNKTLTSLTHQTFI